MRFRFQTFVTQLKTSILTANRTIALPDASGTLQLWGDQPVSSPEGLVLIYLSGTQLTISAGRATIPTVGNRTIAILPSSLTKILTSTWTAGTNQGGSFAGTVAGNQTWHVFVIKNITTGVVDVGFDLSVTGANIPNGWVGRIIGSIMTDSSSLIRSFVQTGDLFQWSTAVQDFSSTNATPTATSNLLNLTVPIGVSVIAFGRMGANNTVGAYAVLAATPGINTDAIIYAYAANVFVIGRYELTTNTSGQIKFYNEIASSFGQVYTWGFYHPRGR